MADLKISALDDGAAAEPDDELPAVRGSGNVKLTAAAIAAAGRGVVKTANYTALSGDDILADTSGGSFTINVPAGGVAGMKFQISDATDSFGTNALTIGKNGQTVNGLDEDMTVSSNGVSLDFYHNGTTWRIRGVPLGA